MELIGTIIDMGGDEQSATALDHATNLLDQLIARKTPDRDACRTHYFRANIWNAKRNISPHQRTWLWKSEAIDGEILELRRALAHAGIAKLQPLERAQIYTNLGNILNHVGRFVEAIECWDRALTAVPKFAMAYGNRGIGLAHYGGALYDSGHEAVLMYAACHSLSEACAEDAVLDSPGSREALEQFAARLAEIWAHYDIPRIGGEFSFENHSLGRGRKEREYRQWCLERRLFVNPLNDVGPNPIAAHDVMTLPSIITDVKEGPAPPAIIHYFNIIKQEYCTSRYALYEGIISAGVHFSDREVLLYNTLDYPAFGFAIERMKAAFRGAYSVFDKTAFLLNAYFGLDHHERQVNFRNLWYVKGKGKALHPNLDGVANWPLRGLFWLSKDIFEDDFRVVNEPDAQELYELRNHMEHKFVSVHDTLLRTISPLNVKAPTAGIFDISVDTLIAKTIRQLKLARVTIIYLSLAVHVEEKRRDKERGGRKLRMPIHLDVWNDSWKRHS